MEFQIGDKVVYPSQGVSVVQSISSEELAGTSMTCYTLRLMSTESLVMVPIANSQRVGLRPLSEPEAVARALNRLHQAADNEPDDWKDRYRANLDRLKTGDLDEVVDVLLCLAEVAGRKTLSFRERKMFDHARQLLVVEVSEVLGRPIDEVRREVSEALQVPFEDEQQ